VSPSVRSRSSLVALLLAATLAALAPTVARADRVDGQVVRALNRVRAVYGLRALRVDARLRAVARRHSTRMARTGVLTHGPSLDRVTAAARSGRVGEVLAALSGTPAGRQARWVVDAWLHSTTHRAVILAGDFRRVGVGRARGHGTVFFTADVAR
jgi:uncharacterized protein YkwD